MLINRFVKLSFIVCCLILSSATISVAQTSTAEIEQLIEKLKSDRSSTREEAAAALGYTGDARAIPALAAALKDPERSVQDAAAEALEQIDHPDAQEALSNRY